MTFCRKLISITPGKGLLFCLLSIILIFKSPSSEAQILEDSLSVHILRQCVDHIYGFEFNEAREDARKIKRSYPDHPVIHLLNGMIIYWENFPMIPGSSSLSDYEKELYTCIRSCEEMESGPHYPEYLLANLGARGMLLLFYADNNLSDKVFPLVKTTYRLIRQAFDYTSFYDDFYFFTGLYNYYREAYPDARPIYKVVAFLFPKGDKEKGLSELRRASQTSVMLKGESASFLSHIYIHYENNYQLAYVYSKYLNDLYPANPQYLISCIKNLTLLKKYDEVENLIASSADKRKNKFYAAQEEIFRGLIQEKKYNNLKLAKQLYNRGLSDMEPFGYYGKEFSAYAYFGLSRIADSEGDKANKKAYRKLALDLTSYRKVNFDD